MFNDEINEQYNTIFNHFRYMETYQDVLGQKLCSFYDSYLNDLNIIVTSIVKKKGSKNNVDANTYISSFFELILIFEQADDNLNLSILETLIEATIKITKNDDIKFNCEAIGSILYKLYFLKR